MSIESNSFKVLATRDHIESIKEGSPLAAIEELIWNALDADAFNIAVILHFNGIGKLEKVIVRDDGTGIKRNECRKAFGNIGGSEKRNQKFTLAGRGIHGKEGKGRIRAFRIGRKVTWRTRYQENGIIQQYDLISHNVTIDSVSIENEILPKIKTTGTEVVIESIDENHPSLATKTAIEILCRRFSIYLLKYQYPKIKITYDGKTINPSSVIQQRKKYPLSLYYNHEIYDSEAKSHRLVGQYF